MPLPGRKNSGQRRTSTKFESGRPDRGHYGKLVDNVATGRQSTQSTAGTGRRRIFANGALVSSTLGSVKKEAKHEKWWHCIEVLHLVFEYVGMHQLFLGQVLDDNQRLFQHEKTEMVPCTALTCKQWSMSARTMTLADFRPLRYSMTDTALHKALQIVRFCKQLYLAECRRLKFLQPSFGVVGKNLLVLNLVGCSNLTDATLCALTMEMPRLRELYVPACPKLEKVAISKGMDGSELEVLDISANVKVTDDAVERLLSEHPNLREMFLSQLEKLSKPKIASKNLELLNLDGCENLTFHVAIGIMKGCPNLKYVTLGDNDKMLEEQCKRFVPLHNIQELNISATFQDDDTVNTALENLPNLVLFDCGNSEFVVNPRLQHPKLEVLVMNLCCELQDESLANLADKLPKLRHLSCNHCDSLIRPQVRHPGLMLADFSNCVYLCSDKKQREWLVCPNLRSLFLGHTQHVTDEELELLLPNLTQLEELNLYQASGIHRPDLSSLTTLMAINIMNCWNLHEQWVEELEAKMPQLKTIFINVEENYVSESDEDEGGDPAGW